MAAADQPVNKIQTFVFLDLETTGLKGDNPRIVELSMIAVSRTHLLAMRDAASAQQAAASAHQAAASAQQAAASAHQAAASPATTAQAAATHTETTDAAGKTEQLPKLPRVLNKYSRLYYPCKLMNPRAEAINGLSNEILEHLPSFSEVSAQALSLFLDLPKPVALVAHNGDRFDFPLLMAELTRVACVATFTDLQCIDTLRAVKDIDALVEREDITEITKLAESFTMDDLEEELLQEEHSPTKRLRTGQAEEERASQMTLRSGRPHESSSPGDRGNQQAMEVSAQPLLTPMKSRPAPQTHTPATPSKQAHPPAQPYTPEAPQPGTPRQGGRAAKESGKVRRILTYGNNNKRKFSPRLSYKQSDIYRRLFGREYAAHRAEADCEALLTICGHYGSRFVEWADTFATAFSVVEPMWLKRKSFSTSQGR